MSRHTSQVPNNKSNHFISLHLDYYPSRSLLMIITCSNEEFYGNILVKAVQKGKIQTR